MPEVIKTQNLIEPIEYTQKPQFKISPTHKTCEERQCLFYRRYNLTTGERECELGFSECDESQFDPGIIALVYTAEPFIFGKKETCAGDCR